jgi:hypothetical protein
MKEINSRSKGFWQPTAGGVYPILRDLEKSGYIAGAWQTQKNRKLKVYRITEAGELILRHAIVKQAEISDNIGILFREFARDVLNVEPASASLMQVPSLFGPFLEEKPKGKETLKHLAHDRKHICEAIETMQERLETIDKMIAELKKGNKNSPPQSAK